jgi:hypothetical protein
MPSIEGVIPVSGGLNYIFIRLFLLSEVDMAKSKEVEIVGQEVAEVRQMTEDELVNEGWGKAAQVTVVVLKNGVKLYASSGHDGYEAGCLYGLDGKHRFFV